MLFKLCKTIEIPIILKISSASGVVKKRAAGLAKKNTAIVINNPLIKPIVQAVFKYDLISQEINITKQRGIFDF